ncbi:MAG: hypothetical protein JST54_28630 [Deltaproteobacteria bacterium]|nr:hypothetical protein [Deltaproteobacteria bacterium]
MSARFVNIIVGAWLFISAFVWVHRGAEFSNTWITGVLAVIFAVLALTWSAARWLNTLLAIWLVIGTLAFHAASPVTLWNNLICAAVLFVASLSPEPEEGTLAPPTRRRATL